MPVVLISPAVYEEVYGKLPKGVVFLILGACTAMFGYPLIHYMEKRLTFERLALFGFFVPFVIWIILVIVKIIVLESWGQFS